MLSGGDRKELGGAGRLPDVCTYVSMLFGSRKERWKGVAKPGVLGKNGH